MTNKDIDKHVGKTLRTLRELRGISQPELAEEAGISFQQIQKYEKGVNRISASRLYQFCQILRVKPNRFFEGL